MDTLSEYSVGPPSVLFETYKAWGDNEQCQEGWVQSELRHMESTKSTKWTQSLMHRTRSTRKGDASQMWAGHGVKAKCFNFFFSFTITKYLQPSKQVTNNLLRDKCARVRYSELLLDKNEFKLHPRLWKILRGYQRLLKEWKWPCRSSSPGNRFWVRDLL